MQQPIFTEKPCREETPFKKLKPEKFEAWRI